MPFVANLFLFFPIPLMKADTADSAKAQAMRSTFWVFFVKKMTAGQMKTRTSRGIQNSDYRKEWYRSLDRGW